MNWFQKLFAGSLITKLQKEVEAYETTVSNLNLQLDTHKKAEEDLSEEVLNLNQKIGTLQREALVRITEIKELKQLNNKANIEIGQLKSQLEAKTKKPVVKRKAVRKDDERKTD